MPLTDSDIQPPGSPTIRTIAMPADTNPAGDIFGGWLMSQMDLAAGSVAALTARGRTATNAVEGMKFPFTPRSSTSAAPRCASMSRHGAANATATTASR